MGDVSGTAPGEGKGGRRAGRPEPPDWGLTRPEPAAPRLYRWLIGACRLIGLLLRLRLELQGAEHLPRDGHGRPSGGWIALGVPHRTWIDPFVLAILLPVEPRLVFLGDGRAIYRSRIRRALFARIGGVVPIWPGTGPAAFDRHLAAARSVLESGAVFALFPEVGPPVPIERARPFGGGIGYFALRTGAPVVPLILGGTHELFVGRRIVLRVLPPVTAESLLRGSGPDGTAVGDGVGSDRSGVTHPADAAADRAAAHRVVAALEAMVAPHVSECHRLVEPPPGARRPFRRLTNLFH